MKKTMISGALLLAQVALACNNLDIGYFYGVPYNCNSDNSGSSCSYTELSGTCSWCASESFGNDCQPKDSYWVTATDYINGTCHAHISAVGAIYLGSTCDGAVPDGDPTNVGCYTTTVTPCGG